MFALITRSFVVAGLLLGAAAPAMAQNSSETWLDRTEAAVSDHLRLGLRIQKIKLSDSERRPRDSNGSGVIDGEEVLDVSYLGSIIELPLEHEYAVAPYAQWFFNDYFGLELAWEYYAAAAKTYWDGHVDGVQSVSGPSLMALFAYPNQSRLTPQLGAGLAWLMLDFDMDAGFHNGGGNYRRTIEPVDDSMLAWVVQAAVEFSCTKNLKVDVYFRHLEAEVDMLFYLSHGGVIDPGFPDKWVLPMSSNMFGVGLKYAF
jgi:opacity protein-like surface antigen